jgi:hypothetical protein
MKVLFNTEELWLGYSIIFCISQHRPDFYNLVFTQEQSLIIELYRTCGRSQLSAIPSFKLWTLQGYSLNSSKILLLEIEIATVEFLRAWF